VVTIPLPFFFRDRIKIPLFTIVYTAILFATDLSFYTVLTVLAAGIHEAGHIITARLCGVRIEQITIYPFGADIRLAEGIHSYRTDFFIASAGAVANFAAGTVFYGFFRHNIYLNFFALCNFLLAAVNLLPASQLDGGGIVRSMVFPIFGMERAEKILKTVSFLAIIFLWSISVYLLFYTVSNLSLLLICVYLFISDFTSFGRKY